MSRTCGTSEKERPLLSPGGGDGPRDRPQPPVAVGEPRSDLPEQIAVPGAFQPCQQDQAQHGQHGIGSPDGKLHRQGALLGETDQADQSSVVEEGQEDRRHQGRGLARFARRYAQRDPHQDQQQAGGWQGQPLVELDSSVHGASGECAVTGAPRVIC